MALPHSLILLPLFLFTSSYAAPQGCAAIMKKHYDPVMITEAVGKWNLVASAYAIIDFCRSERLYKYGWTEIIFQENKTQLYIAFGKDGSIGVTEIEFAKLSEEPDGIAFSVQGFRIITMQKKVSEDCVFMNWPGAGYMGMHLACKTPAAPQSLVEEFIRYAACKRYPYTNVRENPINYASICPKELDNKYSIAVIEFSGRWTLVAKASSNSSSMTADENYVNDWIEFTRRCDGQVILTRSPDSKNLEEIIEGEYIIQEKELTKSLGTDMQAVILRFFHTCADCMLLAIKRRDIFRTTFLLLSRSGAVPDYEKENFKNHAVCRALSHVYGIPFSQQNAAVNPPVLPETSAVAAGSICDRKLQKDPLKDINKISGLWNLVAKASLIPVSSAVDENYINGSVKFTVHSGEEVTVTWSSDTTDLEEIKKGDYTIKDNELHLKTDSQPVVMTVYETCPDYLLLHVSGFDSGSTASTFFLLTKSWIFYSYERHAFEIQAHCKNLTNIYQIKYYDPKNL